MDKAWKRVWNTLMSGLAGWSYNERCIPGTLCFSSAPGRPKQLTVNAVQSFFDTYSPTTLSPSIRLPSLSLALPGSPTTSFGEPQRSHLPQISIDSYLLYSTAKFGTLVANRRPLISSSHSSSWKGQPQSQMESYWSMGKSTDTRRSSLPIRDPHMRQARPFSKPHHHPPTLWLWNFGSIDFSTDPYLTLPAPRHVRVTLRFSTSTRSHFFYPEWERFTCSTERVEVRCSFLPYYLPWYWSLQSLGDAEKGWMLFIRANWKINASSTIQPPVSKEDHPKFAVHVCWPTYILMYL